MAHAAGARHAAVRVSSDELNMTEHREQLNRLGIDLVVNEHHECAREILSVLTLGGAREFVSMVENRIQAVGVNVPEGSPLLAGPRMCAVFSAWSSPA
ncbi:MAG: hypothetical protein JW951_09785 [Lentisphaerae bacterium]|nr:hypothetical protein [Lentisphaerota bacterium]